MKLQTKPGARPIPLCGLEHYCITPDGNFWKYSATRDRWRTMSLVAQESGRLMIYLTDRISKEQFCLAAARLVLLTFVGEPPKGRSIVVYRNTRRDDISVDNLKWGSPKDRQAITAERRTFKLLANLTPHRMEKIYKDWCKRQSKTSTLARKYSLPEVVISTILSKMMALDVSRQALDEITPKKLPPEPEPAAKPTEAPKQPYPW